MVNKTDTDKGSDFDLNQKIKFLQNIEFFDNFDQHELKQFLAVTRWLKVAKGTQIITENTKDRAFYILVKGQVSVVKTVANKPKPVELTTLKAGACFGEMSLVMDVKITAGVITTSSCFILMVEPDIINTSNVFLQVKFYKRFCEILVRRLILANERMAILDQASHPTKKKLQTPAEKQSKKTSPAKNTPVSHDQNTATIEDSYDHHENTVMVLPAMPDKKDKIVKRKIQRKIKNLQELPVNPSIAARLTPYMHGECENTKMFSDLIQLDPILSIKVLQIANSSYFRRTTPVATVAHAIITIGIKQIQEALSETIETAHSLQAFSGFHELARSFWRHSIIVARIANMLKDVIRINISSDIYLAGLLHDIGILALDPLEPDFYPQLIDPDGNLKESLLDSENQFIGIDHAQAGCWFGESIGLPASYLEVISHHHNPERAKNSALMVAIVHLADQFAMSRDYGVGGKGYETEILKSFGWVILQDKHRPFLDVHLPDFINTFNHELDNTWSGLTSGLDF
jgi:HD-like signal output (HDOD) protein/CRP-like cAMP-binding protein